MPLDVTGIFDNLTSHAMALGIFERVNNHEPKMAPNSGLSYSIWFQAVTPSKSGLASTSCLVVFNSRVYQSMLMEPQDLIDPLVLGAVDSLMTAYQGDFDCGSKARNIDVFGEEGVKLAAVAGYINQDNKLYRCITLTIPVIVNDVWNQVS